MTFAVRNLGSGISPITIPTNWGTSGPSATPITSATKTLTVPAGNPGNVLLHLVTAPSGTIGYSKNAAAFTSFTVDTVVNFADTDTLAFRLTGAGDFVSLTVTDNTVLVSVGTCIMSTT
jgi:hypothetical protein